MAKQILDDARCDRSQDLTAVDTVSMLLGQATGILTVCTVAADPGVMARSEGEDTSESLLRSLGLAARLIDQACEHLGDHHPQVFEHATAAGGLLETLSQCHGAGHRFFDDTHCWVIAAAGAELRQAHSLLEAA